MIGLCWEVRFVPVLGVCQDGAAIFQRKFANIVTFFFRRYCTVCITIGKQSTPVCLNCEVTNFFCHDRCGVSAEHERCNLLC